MTPVFESIRKHSCAAVVLASCALVGLSTPAAEAKKPNIRRISNATITFDLVAVDGSAAAGSASIKLNEGRRESSAELELNATGLQPGNYVVDATLEDASV